VPTSKGGRRGVEREEVGEVRGRRSGEGRGNMCHWV